MALHKTADSILALPRYMKRLIAMVVDASLCVLTVCLAFYLRLDEWIPMTGDSQWRPGLAAAGALLVALPVFVVCGLYRAIFRYAGWQAMRSVTWAVCIYGVMYAAVFTAVGIPGVPRSIGLIQPILFLLAVGASRAFARYWLGDLYQDQLRRMTLPKVLIYGAGTAGRELAAALAGSHEMRVTGYLDDDARLQGRLLNGLPVHAPADLPALAGSLPVQYVLLAIPSASRQRRNEILELLRQAHVSVRTLPSLTDIVQGRVRVSDLRELDIDDLLGRDQVVPDPHLLARNIGGKTVLVTGAGGSIGSELCRQIARLEPAVLLLVDQSEFALYQIHQELLALLPDESRLIPFLASVCDEKRLREIVQTWRPRTIYHAAAYKHVPLVEHNPVEGLRNNVFGTLAAARVAREAGVEDFVLVSTDKAVRPTNIMGASKRLAEMVLQAMAAFPPAGTRFVMVRFGNVLGSSGSVVPKFRQQIKDGGPITLTHPEITRYFMTIPEASQLVIQAGAMARGGDVFVLDMGSPVRIYELARRMVELCGLSVREEDNPDGDIEIQITGLRPGEKLFEELLIGGNPEPTLHPRIMRAHEDFLPWDVLDTRLSSLQAAMEENDVMCIRRMLGEVVAGYAPDERIADWIHTKKTSGEETAPAGAGQSD